MTDILGYDVDGEPLRAGDRAAYVGLKRCAYANGAMATVISALETGTLCVTDEVGDGKHLVRPFRLRKLKDDSHGKEHYKDQHKPCGQSFDELVKGFGRVEA